MSKTNDTKDGISEEPIYCAMTDDQYHEILGEIGAIEGLLELLRPFLGDVADVGTIVALNLMSEKAKSAQDLMEAAWHRTCRTEDANA